MPVRPGTKKKFAVTLIMSVAAFVLLTGQFCPFGGGQQAQAPAAAPAPAPVAAAPAPAPAPAVTDSAQAQPQEAAPQLDTSNLQVQSLTLTDANGKARAVLSTDDSGAPSFTFLDGNGGTRSRLSLDGNGNPFIDLYSSKGEILSSYWIENDEPFLTYRGKDGQPVTIIPKEAAAPPRPVAVTTTRPVVVRTPPPPSASNAGMTVYVSGGTGYYHLRTCRHLEGHKKNPMTLADAVAAGYKPDPFCRPPVLGASTGSVNRPVSVPAGTVIPREGRGGSVSAVGEQTVYVVNGLPNYHLRGCPRLDNKKKHPMALSDAIANGYKPCPQCRPPIR